MLVREFWGLRVWHWLHVVICKFGTHFAASWISWDVFFVFDGPRFDTLCNYTVNPVASLMYVVWLDLQQCTKKTPLAIVFLFFQCNFDFQAVNLYHNHILPGLFNICSRFNYNSSTGVSVFRINQSLHQPVPGQSAVTRVCVHHLPTPVGHAISKTHRTQALALGGLCGYMCPSSEQLWQIQLDLVSGKCSRGLFFLEHG